MEVLQDGDPGLAKKRAMLGLDPGDKPILSQVIIFLNQLCSFILCPLF